MTLPTVPTPITYVVITFTAPAASYCWGDRAVAMPEALVDPRVTFGPLTRELSDFTGRMASSTFEFEVSDYDQLVASLLEQEPTAALTRRVVAIYLTFDNWWRASEDPLSLFHGVAGRVDTLAERVIRFRGDDYVTAEWVLGPAQ